MVFEVLGRFEGVVVDGGGYVFAVVSESAGVVESAVESLDYVDWCGG